MIKPIPTCRKPRPNLQPSERMLEAGEDVVVAAVGAAKDAGAPLVPRLKSSPRAGPSRSGPPCQAAQRGAPPRVPTSLPSFPSDLARLSVPDWIR